MKKWDVLYAFFYYLMFGFLFLTILFFSIIAIDLCWVEGWRHITLNNEIVTISLMSLNWYLLFRFSQKWLGIYPNIEGLHWRKIMNYIFYEICIWLFYTGYILISRIGGFGGLGK